MNFLDAIIWGTEFEVSDLFIACFVGFCILLGLFLLRLNYLRQIRVALYMDIESVLYNRNGIVRYLERNLSKYTSDSTLMLVELRNLKYLYELTKDRSSLMQEIGQLLFSTLYKDEMIARLDHTHFLMVLSTSEMNEIIKRTQEIEQVMLQANLDGYGQYLFDIWYSIYVNWDTDHIRRSINRLYLPMIYGKPNNKIYEFNSEIERIESKLNQMDQEKEDALRNGNLRGFIQPKVELSTGKVVGYELLARWVDNNNVDIYSPNEFIPLFEQSDFITELDCRILDDCCKLVNQSVGKDLNISFNFSAANFKNAKFEQMVNEVLNKNNVSASRIEAEIKESSLASDIPFVSQGISQLRRIGFNIALDNFGAEGNVLQSLPHNPFRTIKIDKSLLQTHLQDEKEQLVVQNLTRIIKLSGSNVIVVGVESELCAKNLTNIDNLVVVQGVYYSKAVPTSEFDRLLNQNHKVFEPERKPLNNVSSENIVTINKTIINEEEINRKTLHEEDIKRKKQELEEEQEKAKKKFEEDQAMRKRLLDEEELQRKRKLDEEEQQRKRKLDEEEQLRKKRLLEEEEEARLKRKRKEEEEEEERRKRRRELEEEEHRLALQRQMANMQQQQQPQKETSSNNQQPQYPYGYPPYGYPPYGYPPQTGPYANYVQGQPYPQQQQPQNPQVVYVQPTAATTSNSSDQTAEMLRKIIQQNEESQRKIEESQRKIDENERKLSQVKEQITTDLRQDIANTLLSELTSVKNEIKSSQNQQPQVVYVQTPMGNHQQPQYNLDLDLDTLGDSDDDDEDKDDEEEVGKPKYSMAQIQKLVQEMKTKYKDNWQEQAQKADRKAYDDIVESLNIHTDLKKSFAERMVATNTDNQKIYNIIKNELMKYLGIQNNVTKNADFFGVGKNSLCKIKITKSTLKVYFRLDPTSYPQGQFKQKDCSTVKAHMKTPMMVKVKSQLAVRRALTLISDLMVVNKFSVDTDYSPKNYILELSKQIADTNEGEE